MTSQHADVVRALRRLRASAAAPGAAHAPGDRCELCRIGLPGDHRHMLHLDDRRILCVCETCWAIRSGDRELRPAGGRTRRLQDFDLPDDVWASFQIPIGLAFFFLVGPERRPVAFYPSPVGAMECELDLSAWSRMAEANPVLQGLEPEAEALLVHRRATPPEYLLVPIDECYRLIGTIKTVWEGLSGGPEVGPAIERFFAGLGAREAAV